MSPTVVSICIVARASCQIEVLPTNFPNIQPTNKSTSVLVALYGIYSIIIVVKLLYFE